jgi:hypothetical protein
MYTQKKSIENTHIVRERDRKRFRELLAVLSLGIPIGLFLLLFTWQNLEVIRLGHDATRLQKQQKDLETANKSLQLELDRLTALDAVEKQATTLGFQPADPKAIVTVRAADSGAAAALGRRIEPLPTPVTPIPAAEAAAAPQAGAR